MAAVGVRLRAMPRQVIGNLRGGGPGGAVTGRHALAPEPPGEADVGMRCRERAVDGGGAEKQNEGRDSHDPHCKFFCYLQPPRVRTLSTFTSAR